MTVRSVVHCKTSCGWFIHKAGSSDLFLILGFVTSHVLYLSFSTLHSISLWRTDTFFAKLSKPPLSNKPLSLFEPLPFSLKCVCNKQAPPPLPGGLNRRFTVSQSGSTKNKCCKKWSYIQ